MTNNKNTHSSPNPLAVSCSLKRKRPPSIEIPNVLQEIKLKDVSVTPQDDTVSFTGLGVAVLSVKGKKKFMEDAHKIVSCLHGNSKQAFFGVYDGHGGKNASDFVAKNLHNNVFEMLKNCKGNYDNEEAVKSGYLKTDEDFLKQDMVSGSCCVTALIEGDDIVVSNLGDCRAVLSRGGVAEALTTDHKADQEDERKRIEDKGGYVEFHRGAWRVHGILTVSRSIGDAHLKQWVVAEPDTKVFHLSPDMEFLVLASDGLWNEVSNQEAVDIVTRVSTAKRTGKLGGHSKENTSPSSKIRKVSLVNQQKETCQSPRYKMNIDGWKGSKEFACEKGSPLSKIRRISVVKRIRTKPESPSQEKSSFKKIPSPAEESLSSKMPRIPLVKQQIETCQSPRYMKNMDGWKDNEDEFACENTSPPSKIRRISAVKRISMKHESPNQENTTFKKMPSPAVGLMAACKELVSLAVSRGSLDDITVMIIDLSQFKCNT